MNQALFTLAHSYIRSLSVSVSVVLVFVSVSVSVPVSTFIHFSFLCCEIIRKRTHVIWKLAISFSSTKR